MPNFTYTRDIPDGPHNPSVDQPDMKTNTNSTDDIFEINHYSFNDNLGGYHKPVNIVNSVSTPVNPAGVGSTLYSTGDNLAFTNPTLSTAGPGMTPVGIQLTVYQAPPVDLSTGRTFLPGGIVMQWGTGVSTGLPVVFNFMSPYSTVFYGLATAASTGKFASAVVSNTSITVEVCDFNGALPAGITFYWQAMGIL